MDMIGHVAAEPGSLGCASRASRGARPLAYPSRSTSPRNGRNQLTEP